MAGRLWTPDELAYICEHYRKRTAAELATALNRSLKGIYQAANTLGLVQPRLRITKAFLSRIKRLNQRGYPDAEIGREIGCDRHVVARWRKRLGLPAQTHSERRRRTVAAKTQEQCREAGVPTLADVRVLAFRQYAADQGWPADLRPRAVQILDLLAERGPMTRRELCEAMGMPWKGSRESLRSNDPEGTYLAHLMARGLVVSLGRIVRMGGKGHNVQVYSLALEAERTYANGDHFDEETA